MTTSEAAVACAPAYVNSTVYTGGMQASYNSHNWTAKWWTQYEAPSTGGSGVWTDNGACDGGTSGGGGTGTCSYPNWVAGQSYATGGIVRYPSNGLYYQATHDDPAYDPTISTWYWSPYTGCSGGGDTGGGGSTSGFVVSEAQFNQMFPSRNSFYTYAGLTDAMKKYPAFATTGSDTVKRQEAAAFLANVSHETGGLVYINEINTANWPTYCDWSQPYGCPAGQSAYYGRGPMQLSWNFNYKDAGDALGIDLLHNPSLVQTDAAVAWIVLGRENPPPENTRARQMAAIGATLDVLERSKFSDPPTIGEIAVACAISYVEFRIPDLDWKPSRPQLAAWYDRFCEFPSMKATVPAQP